MPPQVISVIGALVTDMFMVVNRMPDRGESLRANQYHESLGGNGANSAIATYRSCHRKPRRTIASADEDTSASSAEDEASDAASQSDDDSDIQVRIVGHVGEDRYGELFRAALNENGVDTSGLQSVPGQRTGMAFIIVEEFTRDNFLIFNYAASDTLEKEDFQCAEDLGYGVRPDLVVSQLEIKKEVVQQMIETAGRAGVDFLLNAAPATPLTRRSCRYITHLLFNESEAAILTGRDLEDVHEGTWPQIAQEYIDRGVKNVIITLGENGAYYATATDHGHVPAYKVDVVDTTGSGDTFTGAYASEYVRQKAAGKTAENWDIRHAVQRANKAGALTAGKLGAQDGIPWEDEIDRFDAELNIAPIHGAETDGGDRDEVHGVED